MFHAPQNKTKQNKNMFHVNFHVIGDPFLKKEVFDSSGEVPFMMCLILIDIRR